MLDVLIRGGAIIDGSGNPWFKGDVAISRGKIIQVGRKIRAQAHRVIDARGLFVSPGWVDVHSHSDRSLISHPHADSLLIQGSTLTVTGNCGISAAPLIGVALEQSLSSLDTATQAPDPDTPGFEVGWSTFDEYLSRLERQGVSMNVASLVGHSTIRLCIIGHAERKATPTELSEMEKLVDASMKAGAFGLSTGLVYWPGCWSDTEEIIALARVAARYQGIYVSHIRGERETNIEATKEAITIGEKAGIPVHISHMQSKFPAYGRVEEKLRLMHQARQSGIDIACDTDAFPWIYYEASSPLPPWPFKSDHETFVAMLKDPESRARLKEEMRAIDPYGPLGRTGDGGIYQQRAWDRVWIYECKSDPGVEGKKISEIASERQAEPEDALFDLIVAEEGKGPHVFVAHIEDDHHITAPDPLCIFPSTDCEAMDLSKVGPRYMQYSQEWLSMFPRVLSRYVKEEGLMTAEEAIRKMTSFACQRFGIRDRGMIREGMWADVTVFDYDKIEARGTYEDPLERPRGIEYVLVNGQVAVEEGEYTGRLAGQVLRH